MAVSINQRRELQAAPTRAAVAATQPVVTAPAAAAASTQASAQSAPAVKAAASPTNPYSGNSELSYWYQQLTNQQPFVFNPATNPLYKLLSNNYATMGQAAMRDATGQAAGLTGGYGSSYSQAAGQQAYNALIQQMNQALPSIYQSEHDAYNNQQSLALARFQDAWNRWMQEREFDLQQQQWEWSKTHPNGAAGGGSTSSGVKKYYSGNTTSSSTGNKAELEKLATEMSSNLNAYKKLGDLAGAEEYYNGIIKNSKLSEEDIAYIRQILQSARLLFW